MRAHRTAASRGPARAALGAAPGRGRRVSPHAGPTEHPFPCGRGSPCPAPWGSHPSRAAARSQPGPLLSVGAGSGGPHRTSLVSRPTGLSTTQVKLVRRSRALKELKSRSRRRTTPEPLGSSLRGEQQGPHQHPPPGTPSPRAPSRAGAAPCHEPPAAAHRCPRSPGTPCTHSSIPSCTAPSGCSFSMKEPFPSQ